MNRSADSARGKTDRFEQGTPKPVDCVGGRRDTDCVPDSRQRLPVVVLIDDVRSFVDGTDALVARTSAEGVALLNRLRQRTIDELWLDHDLGGDDTIRPVVTVLEEAAFTGRRFDIRQVYVHTSNPAGAETVVAALHRWGYPTRRTSAEGRLRSAGVVEEEGMDEDDRAARQRGDG